MEAPARPDGRGASHQRGRGTAEPRRRRIKAAPPRARLHSERIRPRRGHLRRRRRPELRAARSLPPCRPPSAPGQHEGLQPGAVRAEGRPLGPQPGHRPQQDAGGRPAEPALQHERLLLQAQGAGAQHPAGPQGEQDGNPAARHRLHPGPAARPGRAPRHRQPAPPAARPERGPDAADRAQHGHQRPVPAGLRVPRRVHVHRQQGALWLRTVARTFPSALHNSRSTGTSFSASGRAGVNRPLFTHGHEPGGPAPARPAGYL